MAEVKSNRITAIEAKTQVDTEDAPGKVTRASNVVAASATQAIGDILEFCAIPSSAIVDAVRLYAADASTAGAIDIGIYTPDGDGTVTVVDADFFASAVDLTGGPMVGLDVTHESGVYTYAKSEQPLWEALGLASDPARVYYVAATVTTAFNGGPTSIKLAVDYRQ